MKRVIVAAVVCLSLSAHAATAYWTGKQRNTTTPSGALAAKKERRR